MPKKTLKQAVEQFKTKSRGKLTSKSAQPQWTHPDLFFGDKFTSVLGSVQLPVSAAGKGGDGDVTVGSKRQRGAGERPEGGFYTVRQVAEKWGCRTTRFASVFVQNRG